MSFEQKPSKPSLVRHKIGAQSSPPAIVLIYSRSDKPEKMRKRVMPLRGLKAFADGEAIAKLMQEAHKEFLDPAHVSVEQLAGLCEKLRCGQAGGAESAAAPPPPVAPLSRELQRESARPAVAVVGERPVARVDRVRRRAAAVAEHGTRRLASGAATATETAVATFGAASSSDDGSPPGRVPSILAPLPAQPSATKRARRARRRRRAAGRRPRASSRCWRRSGSRRSSLLGMSERRRRRRRGAPRRRARRQREGGAAGDAGLAGMPPLRAL